MERTWISTKDRVPTSMDWCWVWLQYDDNNNGEGFCEKMFFSQKEGWKKNTLSSVKPEYQSCIKAWQKYYEPEPYKIEK